MSLEERVSRLEGGCEHLATKADVAELKAGLAELKAELIKWMVGLMVASVAVASAIALVVQRIVG